MFKNNLTINALALTCLVSFGYTFTHSTVHNTPIDQQHTQQITEKIQQTLLNGGYTPECIQSLDLAYPSAKKDFYCPETNPDRQILDEILIQHYYNEAKTTLTTIAPDKQLLFIEQEKTKCTLDPYAIAMCQDGPYLMYTKDGSDRGALGRRFKAYSQLEEDLISGKLTK
jgi:hypothetical protein